MAELELSQETERWSPPPHPMPGAPTAFPQGTNGGTLLGPQVIVGTWKFHNCSHVIACLNYAISMNKCNCLIRVCNQTIAIIGGKVSRNDWVCDLGERNKCVQGRMLESCVGSDPLVNTTNTIV